MKTLPAIMAANARGGGRFIYVVDIYPRGSDSWGQLRYAEAAITVDGNAYAPGFIKKIGEVRDEVRIVEGGGVATKNPIPIELHNRDGLGFTFQDDDIEGRDIRVSLALLPSNLLLNSSFEDDTADNFDNWTETDGHGSNTITAETGTKHIGAQSVRLNSVGTPGAKIESDAFTVRQGQTLSVSFYAKAGTAADVLNVYIKVDGKYWEDTLTHWHIVATVPNPVTPDDTAFERFTFTCYDPAKTFSAEEVTGSVIFEVPNSGEDIYIDAVMVEPLPRVNEYHGHRTEMVDADLRPIYYGEIREPEMKLPKIKLKTKTIMNRRHRKIPIDIISNDFDADWIIPPASMGKPFPMTYGSFSGDDPFDHAVFLTNRVTAIGVIVNHVHESSSNPFRAVFDTPRTGIKHKLALDLTFHVSDDGRYHPDRKELSQREYTHRLIPGDVIGNDSYVKYVKAGRAPIVSYLRGKHVNTKTQSVLSGWANEANLVDEDVSNYMAESWSSLAGWASGYLITEPGEFIGGVILGAYALIHGQLLNTTGGPKFQVILDRSDPAYQNGPITIITGDGTFDNVPWSGYADSETFIHFTGAKTLDLWKPSFWRSSDLGVRLLIKVDTFGTTSGDARAYAAGFRVDSSIDINDLNIASVRDGRITDDTWGGRKATTELIESPAEIVEGIIRQELSVAAANIDTDSFNDAHTARLTWKMAGQTIEIKRSEDVIDDICRAAGLVYFNDMDGKEALRALDHGAAVKTLQERDFTGDITVTYVPRDAIHNDFTFKYAFSHHVDDHLQSLYCNKDGQNLGASSYATKCSDIYTTLGDEVYQDDIETEWIVDNATAIKALKWLIDWRAGRRRIVKGELFLDQLGIEFGDLIELNLPRHLNVADTDPDRPVFTPFKMGITKKGKRIEFIEVLEP